MRDWFRIPWSEAIVIVLVVAVLSAAVVVVFGETLTEKFYGPRQNAISGNGAIVPPILTEAKPPNHSFSVGDRVHTLGSIEFCTDGTHLEQRLDESPCQQKWNMFYNVVEITGQVVLNQGVLYWPIRVVQGYSVYVEGAEDWVADSKPFLEKVTSWPSLPRPAVEVGDRVRTDFGFTIRNTPCGQPKTFFEEAIPGGTLVLILSGPTLCQTGQHYWCEVRMLENTEYLSDLEGWIPCEVN